MVMANFGHLVAFKKAVLGWHKAENMRRSVLHMLMLCLGGMLLHSLGNCDANLQLQRFCKNFTYSTQKGL